LLSVPQIGVVAVLQSVLTAHSTQAPPEQTVVPVWDEHSLFCPAEHGRQVWSVPQIGLAGFVQSPSFTHPTQLPASTAQIGAAPSGFPHCKEASQRNGFSPPLSVFPRSVLASTAGRHMKDPPSWVSQVDPGQSALLLQYPGRRLFELHDTAIPMTATNINARIRI
jgi:hypothetical protein